MDGSKKSEKTTRLESSFPRTSDLPTQSPKYWAKEKDRYIRQLLISDIQKLTGRPLIVYFSQLDQQVSHTDPDDLSEIIQGVEGRTADLLIQTPGGNVDATEKIISVLRQAFDDYRVIVPSWAKFAGTVIAISSAKIILGLNSELGPIDPQWTIGGNSVPCELVAQDMEFPEHVRQMASLATDRMRHMATELLQRGMMNGKNASVVDEVISKISSSSGYKSHGAVIDFTEASQLGLSVEYWPPDNEEWKRIWLLYCLYDYDMKSRDLAKILEGERYSISRPR